MIGSFGFLFKLFMQISQFLLILARILSIISINIYDAIQTLKIWNVKHLLKGSVRKSLCADLRSNSSNSSPTSLVWVNNHSFQRSDAWWNFFRPVKSISDVIGMVE